MDADYMNFGQVPSNIDFDGLLKNVEGKKGEIKFLRDGMVYLLSKLKIDNYYQYKLKDGFVTLKEEYLANIIGKDRPSKIVKILKSNNIIEVRNYSAGNFSRGYRLREKYNTGEFVEIEYSDRIKSKLKEYHRETEEKKKQIKTNYHYIFNQFDKNQIKIDTDKLYPFLKNLSEELFQKQNRLRNDKELTYNSILNFIGRAINISEDINKKRFRLTIAESNSRFFSNITSLPKTFRPFLTVNGESIGEVDISTSQPYLLSVLIGKYFLENNTTFNLGHISSDMDNLFGNIKSIMGGRGDDGRVYILGRFFNKDYSYKLKEFVDYDFSNDWYQHVYDKGCEVNYSLISSSKKFLEGRNYIKKQNMNFLYEKNFQHRNNNKVIQLLKQIYPELNDVIEKFYQMYHNSDLPLLLQQIESYLILGQVCKYINDNESHIPYFTIHDCVLTTQNNLEKVHEILNNKIMETTSKHPGLRTKFYNPSIEVSKDVLEETWKKVRITSPEHYEKMRTYILMKNIEVGKQFLGI